jgi:hypothetical protein
MGWHDLRHTYGSHWAMKGGRPQGLPGADGARDPQDDDALRHLSLEAMRDAVQLRDTSCWRGGLQGQRQWGEERKGQ